MYIRILQEKTVLSNDNLTKGGRVPKIYTSLYTYSILLIPSHSSICLPLIIPDYDP